MRVQLGNEGVPIAAAEACTLGMSTHHPPPRRHLRSQPRSSSGPSLPEESDHLMGREGTADFRESGSQVGRGSRAQQGCAQELIECL